jgi:hypothetical protein
MKIHVPDDLTNRAVDTSPGKRFTRGAVIALAVDKLET